MRFLDFSKIIVFVKNQFLAFLLTFRPVVPTTAPGDVSGSRTNQILRFSKENGIQYFDHLNTGRMNPILLSYVLVQYLNGQSCI